MNGSPLSEPLSEFIFSSTTDGILITNEDGVLQHVNPTAAALLNADASDLVGQAPRTCFADNPALLSLFTLPGSPCCFVDLPDQRHANGIAATTDGGQRIVLLQDLTSQNNLVALREAFVTTLAHDLRNPIAALIGYAELVGESGDLNDEQRYFAQRLNQTAVKLHDLAAELIDLSWIEAGLPISTVAVALRQPIEDVIAELTAAAQRKQISITASIQDPLPLVIGDPDRLRLVISKLLDNAIVYSTAGQAVIIRAWSDAQSVYCSVTDRGIGISPDEIDLIFDRLYRSRSEAVQKLPGGGLGLTIARRIVVRHGGAIWAESELGSGTTVTFKLPAVAPDA